MQALLYVLIIVGAFVMIGCGLTATSLWRGRWMTLVAEPVMNKKGRVAGYTEADYEAARRLSWVFVGLFAVLLTALMMAMSTLTGNDAFTLMSNYLNIAMLVVFAIIIAWAVVAQYRAGNPVAFGTKGRARYYTSLFACVLIAALFSTITALA